MTFLPRGATGEVIKVEALKKLYGMMNPNESQYLAIYINNPDEFDCNFINPPNELFKPFITFSVDLQSEFDDVSELIYKIGIKSNIEKYIEYSEEHNICSFPKDMLIKVSETETMRYGDYINMQVKKLKSG